MAAEHHVDRKTVRKYLDQEDFNAPPPPPAAPKALREEISSSISGDQGLSFGRQVDLS